MSQISTLESLSGNEGSEIGSEVIVRDTLIGLSGKRGIIYERYEKGNGKFGYAIKFLDGSMGFFQYRADTISILWSLDRFK